MCHTYFTLHGNFRLGSFGGRHQGSRRSGKGSRRRKQMAMFALRCFSLKEAKAVNEKHIVFPLSQHLASKPDIWVGDEDCLW